MAEVDIERSVAIGARTLRDGFADKRLAQTEFMSSKADPAAVLNATDIVVRPVFRTATCSALSACWQHSGWLEFACRGPDGALEVVDVTPLAEVPLGVVPASESPIRQDLGNHRAMEAFILAVGLRMCWAAVAETNTETYQPHAQRAGHADATRSPRGPVVGVDTFGQAVAFEGCLQHTLHRLAPLVAQRLQDDVEARVIVQHRQGWQRTVSVGKWPLKSICQSALGTSCSKRCHAIDASLAAWLIEP